MSNLCATCKQSDSKSWILCGATLQRMTGTVNSQWDTPAENYQRGATPDRQVLGFILRLHYGVSKICTTSCSTSQASKQLENVYLSPADSCQDNDSCWKSARSSILQCILLRTETNISWENWCSTYQTTDMKCVLYFIAINQVSFLQIYTLNWCHAKQL